MLPKVINTIRSNVIKSLLDVLTPCMHRFGLIVESSFVSKEVRQIQQKVSGLKMELDALTRSRGRHHEHKADNTTMGSGIVGQAYHDVMQLFLVTAIPRSSTIGRRLGTATEVTNRLATYFGESSGGWEEFFKHFDHFITSFAVRHTYIIITNDHNSTFD
jgi:hypothetical protein